MICSSRRCFVETADILQVYWLKLGSRGTDDGNEAIAESVTVDFASPSEYCQSPPTEPITGTTAKMKSPKSLLVHGLVGVAGFATATATSSRQALMYTFDQNSQSQIRSTESISLDTAHLILDRRLDTQVKSSIGDVTDEIVDSLNRHGGLQRPLLADSSNDRTRKVLIALEGYDFREEGMTPSSLRGKKKKLY